LLRRGWLRPAEVRLAGTAATLEGGLAEMLAAARRSAGI
jgi:hypothetical protein